MRNKIYSSLIFLLVTITLVSINNVNANEGRADLAIKKDISRLQEKIFPGNNGIYNIEVENVGQKKADGLKVAFYFNQERQCVSTIDLEPGESKTVWCGYSASLVGDLHSEVVIDYLLSIPESDEDNNTTSKTFFISPPEERSDIDATPEITYEPASIHTGDDVLFSATITNNTKWPTGNFNSFWYLNGAKDAVCSIGISLVANESGKITCLIEDLAVIDNLSLSHIVDKYNRVIELNESNNSKILELVVLPARSVPYEYVKPGTAVETNGPGENQEVLGVADESAPAQPQFDPNAPVTFESQATALLSGFKEYRDEEQEVQIFLKHLINLRADVAKVSTAAELAILDFITYGVDQNTEKLGAGERAAVIYSYKSAYEKLPNTVSDLADVLRIANGRWPVELNMAAQDRAHSEFYKIYLRIADMQNPNDNAAITIMSYGLKQKAQNRNLDSEKAGIKTFKAIYGHNPSSTNDWNIMQAITYSGASR